MILQYVQRLNTHRIVLASKSPRRKEILENIGLAFEIKVSSFEEDLPQSQFSPAEYAIATAREKAKSVAAEASDARLVIAADTVVDKDGTILEKAQDEADATRMLTMLAGGTHQVHTGVVLVTKKADSDEPVFVEFSETTKVCFAPLSSEEIAAYIATGDCWGKAGSYGIQKAAGAFVEYIEGDYFNVMGFPLHKFSKTVHQMISEGTLSLT